jgi:hypothetical protein
MYCVMMACDAPRAGHLLVLVVAMCSFLSYHLVS